MRELTQEIFGWRRSLLSSAKPFAAVVFLGSAGTVAADAPVVEDVQASEAGATWSFSVTLSHGDSGWDDYADGWRIFLADGTVLGARELLHPHVEEQPFTRSLSGVTIPDGVESVFVEARTNVDGWSGKHFEVPLE